jgi:hypothetical protein
MYIAWRISISRLPHAWFQWLPTYHYIRFIALYQADLGNHRIPRDQLAAVRERSIQRM